jgi:hypothetical protein
METYEQKVLRLRQQNRKFRARYYINNWQTGRSKYDSFFRALRGNSFPFRANVPKAVENNVNVWLLGYAPQQGCTK